MKKEKVSELHDIKLKHFQSYAWHEFKEKRFLKRDFVGDYIISTVFLGLTDPNPYDKKSDVFETIIFCCNRSANYLDYIYLDRCPMTESGGSLHKKAKEWLKNRLECSDVTRENN